MLYPAPLAVLDEPPPTPPQTRRPDWSWIRTTVRDDGADLDFVLNVVVGRERVVLEVAAGLLEEVLDGSGLDLRALLAVPLHDRSLVLEHLVAGWMVAGEAALGRSIAISGLARRVAPAAVKAADDESLHEFHVVSAAGSFRARVSAQKGGRVDLKLAALPILPSAGAAAFRGGAGAAEGRLAIGPIVLPGALLADLAAGDLLALDGEDGLSGGLSTGGWMLPVRIGEGVADLLPAFRDDALAAPPQGERRLWIAFAEAAVAGDRLQPGGSIPYVPLPKDEALLLADDARAPVAIGRLVETDGRVAFEVKDGSAGR